MKNLFNLIKKARIHSPKRVWQTEKTLLRTNPSAKNLASDSPKLFNLTKRQKIVITSIILFLGFIFTTQTINIIDKRYYFIFILGGIAYLLSLWSLWEGMTKTKALILLILPTVYCIGMVSFYFLFREIRWLTRLPMAVFFGLSFYLLLLSQNVFSVASIRTIPLYRAASSTSFVYTILTSILMFVVIFSFELPFYWNGLLTAVAVFPLFLQILWSVKMDRVDSQITVYSIGLSLIVGELAIAFSFWPQLPFVRSMFLAAIIYALLGIVLEFVRDRLSGKVVIEYGSVGVGIFIFVFAITTLLVG